MNQLRLVCAFIAVGSAAVSSAETISREGAMEKTSLVSTSDAKAWAPAESSAEPSTARVKIGKASWHWRVDVDHFAGEAKYPIGWPRIGHAIPGGPLRDWSGWDFLHLWVYVETSRDALPKDPVGLGLHTPDRAGAYNRALSELKKDQWVELNLPISQIPRHDDVRNIQFHIAESNYRHGDRLDIYLNDLALVRYAEPTLFDFGAEHAVLFSDARRLPVRFQLLGVRPEERVNVTCEFRRDGRTAARVATSAGRGLQRVVLELGQQDLQPGTYELHASVAGKPQAATASVRVVDSPWR